MKQELVTLLEHLQNDKLSAPEISISSDDEDDIPLARIITLEEETQEKTLSLAEQLNQALQKQVLPTLVPKNQTLEARLFQEMEMFQNGGQRGPNLQLAYDILCTIPPTSVEAERCFSAAGLILTKFRSSMLDETLDNLIFLRYFLKEKK